VKFLILGAGRMGYAMVYDLIRSAKVEQIIVADQNVKQLEYIKKRLPDEKVVPVELNVMNVDEVTNLMARSDIAVSCVPHNYNYELAKAALAAKTNYCDLGGGESQVTRTFLLNDIAKEEEITIIPDLGLAPGLVSILAGNAAESLDEVYEIRMRAGSVPVEPQEPLNYAITHNVDRLIDEYVEDTTIIRDGRTYRVPSLSDVESVEFPKPFGDMEAFLTSGGASTMPINYTGKVQHLDFKTIRYPGHCQQINTLKKLELFSHNQVALSNGNVVPRELISKIFSEKLSDDSADAVLLKVTVTGIRQEKPIQIVWDCIDYGDEAEGLTGMMRMTAFPASIVAQMIVRGDIDKKGVLSQEQVVPAKLFLAEMAGRGVTLTMVEREPVLPEKTR